MITKQEALALTHRDLIYETTSCRMWRVNGAVKTWKRSPAKFSVPIKRGLYEYGHLTDGNAATFVTEKSLAGNLPSFFTNLPRR